MGTRGGTYSAVVDGALGWKSAEIAPYLSSCLAYFDDSALHKPDREPG
jgi:hypothetical protein